MVSYDVKRLAFVLCLNNKCPLKTASETEWYQSICFQIIFFFFYLRLNFRHTIQCVHDSKAPTGHLGGCSPHERIQAWHPCFWIAKSREISHYIRSVGTRTCSISFPEQCPDCSLLWWESLSPHCMMEQGPRQNTALGNTTYSQD